MKICGKTLEYQNADTTYLNIMMSNWTERTTCIRKNGWSRDRRRHAERVSRFFCLRSNNGLHLGMYCNAPLYITGEPLIIIIYSNDVAQQNVLHVITTWTRQASQDPGVQICPWPYLTRCVFSFLKSLNTFCPKWSISVCGHIGNSSVMLFQQRCIYEMSMDVIKKKKKKKVNPVTRTACESFNDTILSVVVSFLNYKIKDDMKCVIIRICLRDTLVMNKQKTTKIF